MVVYAKHARLVIARLVQQIKQHAQLAANQDTTIYPEQKLVRHVAHIVTYAQAPPHAQVASLDISVRIASPVPNIVQ
jgi:hypothetical protein